MWSQQKHHQLLVLMALALLATFFVTVTQASPTPTLTGSPWLRNLTNDGDDRRFPHPHSQIGCQWRPWICRDRTWFPFRRGMCCRNRCIDVAFDPNNCGLCRVRCPFTWQCCSGRCVNVNISPFNCGRCGNRCPFGVFCIYGMCGYAQPIPFPPRRPYVPMPPPGPPRRPYVPMPPPGPPQRLPEMPRVA
ncbi:hypothetical protein QJS04_geneDACA016254 [Acorus gramineus]|uniref:Stigma-specific Stig1 family protein n=1 Tax=Acorus gramineus TaxID=55184 RepID=A0AAV9AIX6_ACOGR|nr:hypothetical protein QJS04_geneDACA016254 [Acorus gramineus]